MNKISTKLAASFFVVVLIMELFLMFYLHRNIIKSKVEEELSSLLANGENHRDVLLENYSDMTIKHIVLMEKNKDREVMITDKNEGIIGRSTLNNTVVEEYMPLEKNLSKTKDQVVVADWRNSPYIVSAHPYKINIDQSGYVIMFQSTSAIKEMVHNLNKHFFISGITSIVVLLAIYALLSKVLTRPLLRMKAATEKLSHGDFNVSLTNVGNDELGELARAIQKLADDLERLQKERNEFLASIAHELSTPLTYLIGYSKVAMRENLNENDRNHYLEIITEESNRMKELVNNLLELAKMDQNSFSVSKEYFSARLFLDNICKRVAPSFDMNNIKLMLVCEEDFEIHADSIRLEQIILNLLDNALKYSDKNTRVIVEAKKQEERTTINVIDAGVGIPSDDLELIFEKLYRVEKSRSRTFGGSGIGLSVVKELVEAHGGTIKVKSNLGEGSTFTITI